MTQRGEAAKALGWALVAALTGGLVSTAVMTTLTTPLSEFALKFGAPEYFAAVFFGLTTVVALAGTSIPNALISLFIGLLVATIGTDSTYGTERFTFNSPLLTNGVPYVMVLVGMYGFGEILIKLGQSLHVELPHDSTSTKTRFPTLTELIGNCAGRSPAARFWERCWARCRAPARPSHRLCPMRSRNNMAAAATRSAPASPKESSRRRLHLPHRSPDTSSLS